jgi:hypothetical protein
MVPCGPVMGSHVAPLCWFELVKVLDSIGIKPATSGHGKESWQCRDTSTPMVVLNTLFSNVLFEFLQTLLWWIKGMGPSPNPTGALAYDHYHMPTLFTYWHSQIF